MHSWHRYLAYSNEQLARIDPVELNLSVARSIPRWQRLEIAPYQRTVDGWAAAIQQRLPHAERVFAR